MDEKYIDALKALAEPNRLRVFWLLVHANQRITVAEAIDVSGETQYNASRNLKMLYKAGLLTQEKRGKWVYYTLPDKLAPHCEKLVESVRSLPQEGFANITARCQKRLAMRVGGECVVGANSEEWLSQVF